MQSFTPLYVNTVLPACDHVIGGFQDCLVRHLTSLWETVKGTNDAHQMEQYLASLQKSRATSEVKLSRPLPPHADQCRCGNPA